MKKLFILVLGLALLSMGGCDDSSSKKKGSFTMNSLIETEETKSETKDAQGKAGSTDANLEKKDASKENSAAEGGAAKEGAAKEGADSKEDAYTHRKAEVGVTGKGQYGDMSGKPMSIVTVPVSTYFQAKERAVFDMQIPQAMNLYKASNGSFPATQEEFISNIIKANNIQLPQLPPGSQYYYDAKNAQLMVRAPK